MDPNQWSQGSSYYPNVQKHQISCCRGSANDKINYKNLGEFNQISPNTPDAQKVFGMIKRHIRDPRLRNRHPLNINPVNTSVSSILSVNTSVSSVPSVSATVSSVPSVSAAVSSVPSVSAAVSSVPSVNTSVDVNQYPPNFQNIFPPQLNFSGGNLAESMNTGNQKSVPFMQSYNNFFQEAYNNYYNNENPNWLFSGNAYYNRPENFVLCSKKKILNEPKEKIVNNKNFSTLYNCDNSTGDFSFGMNWNNCIPDQNKIPKAETYKIEFHNKISQYHMLYQNISNNNAGSNIKKSENVDHQSSFTTKVLEQNILMSSNETGVPSDIKSDGCSVSYSRSSKESYNNKSTEYDSSMSRSQDYYSKVKCERSKSRSRSRSRSRSCSRSRSRSHSRSRNYSRTRYRSRSRSQSRQRNFRSRSRSRSNSRSRYRYRSRSKSQSRSSSGTGFYSKTRSRSRSRSRRRDSFSRSYTYGRRDREKNYKDVHENERQKLIEKWRMNNCDTQDEMQKRLQEIYQMDPDEILEEENKVWIRSAPADCYYERDPSDLRRMRATPRLDNLCEKFKCEILDRGNRVRRTQTLKCPSPPKPRQKLCKHKSQVEHSSTESGTESDETDDVNDMIEELQRKQKHPYRLHPELWYNDPGEMNDGPLCRCSAKARRSGIRHGFYAGENQRFYCNKKSNNADSLYHYRITISPPTNFLTRTPTIINYDDHEFIFEGFSLISHYPIEKLPTCKVIRFNIEYIILYVEEKLPENFCIQELDLFYNYLFKEILELVDFDLSSSEFPDSCPQFHFMPRFVRELPENGRELLPMCEILKYLLESNKKLIDDNSLEKIHKMSNSDWQNFADLVKGMVVTNPGMKPCSLRVDQLDRDTDEDLRRNSRDSPDSNIDSRRNHSSKCFPQGKDTKQSLNEDKAFFKVESDSLNAENNSALDSKITIKIENKPEHNNNVNESNLTDKLYPEIVHFGIRPPQLSYAGNPEYQKAWRKYVKFRHLLANMPKPTPEDKQKLAAKENGLHSMRAQNKMKRDVTITVSSKGFYLTGLMCDVVQHAMLIPVLVCHLRFHRSLSVLECKIGYKFKNRFLLQLALTHPSYRENFGTNSDHARNSLTNCGIRQPKYGDRRIHYMNTRKRGINTLISIMSRFGEKNETQSNIYHNERLEFLGDAVVEFITSIHLFHIFRDLEEGGLATYRAALVQNQHLAVLAKKLHLDEFMLYAHGSDLCHDLELKHAMANCFEALMGALFLDGGIEAADRVFGNTLYGDEEDCLDIWFNYPPHPLQEQEPLGDRKWIPQFPLLQKLTEFEDATGIEFKHIRLLARAFTDRSVGYTNLTLGSNQRLEFLGDSVLQLIASEYLYKYFPEHHEGHLSLLRSSLVNNKTQSVVCDDLGMTKYAVYANPKVELKIKDRADLLEAFLGALYVDSGLEICHVFCDVCFFPRLQIFIMNQDWNDPKSKLQQCCLTLRTMDNVEPDIPIYKVVECKGPTNTRVYTVAVYFRNKRLAKATGHSIQQAEMNAAQKAMEVSGPLFPQLDHQKRVIAKSLKTQKWPNRRSWSSESWKESSTLNKADHGRQSSEDNSE